MNASPALVSGFVLAALGALAGCDNSRSLAAPQPASATAPGSAMEFRGERACADCIGIEAWLKLEQRGKQQHYRMIERYRSADRERRFEDEGEWQASGDLLRLRSGAGGERVYLVLPDNRLQAADSRGRALPAAADELMVPVAYSNDE